MHSSSSSNLRYVKTTRPTCGTLAQPLRKHFRSLGFHFTSRYPFFQLPSVAFTPLVFDSGVASCGIHGLRAVIGRED